MKTNILNRKAVWTAGLMQFLLACGATPICPAQTSQEQDAFQASASNDTAVPAALPAFLEAVENGDATTVVQLLDGNPEQVNLRVGWDGRTPLQRCIQLGHQDLAEILLEQGADVDGADYFGWTALHHAAADGKEETVAFLLNKGADVDRQAHQGETPLHWAVSNNHRKTAILLVRCGARLNALDRLGRTPLDIAVIMNHIYLQKFLLGNGCLTAKELADIYDWTASQKSLGKLHTFQRELERARPKEREDSERDEPVQGDAL